MPPPAPPPPAAQQDTQQNNSQVKDSQCTTEPCPLEDIEVALLWQEYHKDAKTGKYSGPTTDDQKVIENPDENKKLQAKPSLHLCFLERAITTMDVKVKKGTWYGWWRIVDDGDNLIKEHSNYKKSNYDSKAAAAKMKTGLFGWMWDGRNNATKPIFAPAGTYRALLTVKGKDDIETTYESSLDLEGEPYHIFILGQPKPDDDMRAEFTRHSRWLSGTGRRFHSDTWLTIHRGIGAADEARNDDGHIVFLAHGAMEATEYTVDKFGAVATPHGRDFKGFIRHVGPPAHPQSYFRIQIQDLGNTDGNIALNNPGGPVPNNPYSDSHGPVKDGVQMHQTYGDVWDIHNMSVGCTTTSPSAGTAAQPSAVRGNVRSKDSSFGSWDTPAAGHDFFNKQNKRNRPDDAKLDDGHDLPLLDPPAPPTGEPLHMQPYAQQAVFGGFKDHEISQHFNVDDEPDHQLRIRLRLEEYAADTMYYQYHHAVAFGHDYRQTGTSFQVWLWIPETIIRTWNGNARNLSNKDCQIAWYIERRSGDNAPQIVHRFSPTSGAPGSYGALPGNFLGKTPVQTWRPLADNQPAGTYTSIFKYKIQLHPYIAGTDAWTAEPMANDLFSEHAAKLVAENLVTDGAKQFIEGRSELEIIVAPVGDFAARSDVMPA